MFIDFFGPAGSPRFFVALYTIPHEVPYSNSAAAPRFPAHAPGAWFALPGLPILPSPERPINIDFFGP